MANSYTLQSESQRPREIDDSDTIDRRGERIFRDNGGGWFWCAAIARRTCVVFLLRTNHSTLVCKHALAVRRYENHFCIGNLYNFFSFIPYIYILFLHFIFLFFAHTSLADATEWKSTVMGSANACARDLVIDSPARLLGHYNIARSRAHGKIRVYDNPAAWRLRLVRVSPPPPLVYRPIC